MPETGPFPFFCSLSLFLSLSLFFSITFLYAFSSSYRISFLHLLAQKLFRTPFSFEASVVVSSLLDSCWSSRRNVFLFDARVLACYARLVNLFSVLNSSRWSMLVPIPIPFPCVFCQRLEFETLTIGQNWRGEKKREKKNKARWKMKFRIFFFDERKTRAESETTDADGTSAAEESLNFSRRNTRR